MTGTAIDADDLVVTRGRRAILSVSQLTVSPGEVLVVLGPNGAGKSTFLQCCVGMVRAQRGRIHVLGQPVHQLRSLALTRLRRRVAYLAQILARGGETPLTLREVVAIGRTGRVGLLRPLRASDWRLVDHWVERFGLGPLAGQLYRTLSGGEQRKALLAMAMVQQPELLLLDEPTANLDAYWREQIVRALEDLHAQVGLTIVLVCHDLEAIPSCARQLLVLNGGQVAGQGAATDVLGQSLIRELYGEGLTVLRRGSRFLLAPDARGGLP
jgi:ABC-type cobalamin/Fe3+-siderophores transport system ATPase subunit